MDEGEERPPKTRRATTRSTSVLRVEGRFFSSIPVGGGRGEGEISSAQPTLSCHWFHASDTNATCQYKKRMTLLS